MVSTSVHCRQTECPSITFNVWNQGMTLLTVQNVVEKILQCEKNEMPWESISTTTVVASGWSCYRFVACSEIEQSKQ